jgi:hypothetical protein
MSQINELFKINWDDAEIKMQMEKLGKSNETVFSAKIRSGEITIIEAIKQIEDAKNKIASKRP